MEGLFAHILATLGPSKIAGLTGDDSYHEFVYQKDNKGMNLYMLCAHLQMRTGMPFLKDTGAKTSGYIYRTS